MKVLYISFSCNPYGGSEDSIGWNVPFHAARSGLDVLVITKEEQREFVEKYFLENEKISNLSFEFVDIPKIYKKIFRGSFYSGRANVWHKKAFSYIKKNNLLNDIDIIHVITPVEFRSLGDYNKFSNCKIVVGPIGGGEYMIKDHYKYLTLKEKMIEKIRIMMNNHYKRKLRHKRFFELIDYCYFANYETRDFLLDIVKCKYEMLTDIGIGNIDSFYINNKENKNCINFAIVGRLHYRKGHLLVLDALKEINVPTNVNFIFIGDGNKRKAIEKKIVEFKLNNRVKLIGHVAYSQINEIYKNIDILLLPSLRETGGVVLAEAIARNIPIITSKAFGSRLFLNNSNSILYDISSKIEFQKILKNIFDGKLNLSIIKENELDLIANMTWDSKVSIFVGRYDNLV